MHAFKGPSAEELEHDFLWRAAKRLPERGRIGIFNRSHYEECAFERHISRNGMLVLKFHLRISKEEQRKRFLGRIDEPAKRWKFSRSDVAERRRWNDYMAAYEDMIRATSTDYAPWYVVPADHKRVEWLLVAGAVVEALEGLKLDFPKVQGRALAELKSIERALKAKKWD